MKEEKERFEELLSNLSSNIFPLNVNVKYENGEWSTTLPGLTKREYFSGIAMQGLVNKMVHEIEVSDMIKLSVKIADKLIEELNK